MSSVTSKHKQPSPDLFAAKKPAVAHASAEFSRENRDAVPNKAQLSDEVSTSARVRLFQGMYDGEPSHGTATGSNPPSVMASTPTNTGIDSTRGTPGEKVSSENATAAIIQKAQDKLTKHSILDSVTSEEAMEAMNALKGLPADQQGRAIEKLSPETFHMLLDKVPEPQRVQFKSLVDNTQEPERKLRLFAAYHKSKTAVDAARDREKTQDEGRLGSRTEEQSSSKHKNQLRDEIVKNTKEEVDAELPFLLEKARAGKLSSAESQMYVANKDREHVVEMNTLQNHIATMEGFSAEDRVQYTKSRVEHQLASGPFNPVTDQEARDALRTAKTLPPDLQGMLIERLDKGAFERFVDNMPKQEHGQFDTLIQHTHTPERKLRLWSEYHKAKATSDANKEKETAQDEGHGPSRSEEQKENRRLNKRREDIIKSTGSEVQDETKLLLNKQRKGSLTEADVDALIERKEHEHAIEMKYNVNLVNDTKTRTDGSKVFWSNKELTELESGLRRVPEEHIRGNKHLKEFRRSGVEVSDGHEDPATGGDNGNGQIRLYDNGMQGHYRHTDDTDPVADHYAGRDVPHGPVVPLEESAVHEVGHDVEELLHSQHSDAVERFYAAAGWQHLDQHQLKGQLIRSMRNEQQTAAAVNEVDSTRQEHFLNRKTLTEGNTVFEADPYSNNYLSFDNRSMPNTMRWSYARSNPQDHWAEFYSSAIHAPSLLYQDMVADPRAQVAAATQEMIMKQARLDAAVTPAARAMAHADLSQAQQQIADKQVAQRSRQTQWNIMRNEVFHTDAATNKATSSLQSLATSPARQSRLAAFQKAAERAATPQQIDGLLSQAMADMRALP